MLAAALRRRVAFLAMMGLGMAALVGGSSLAAKPEAPAAAPAAPKYDIETVMKKGFKGDAALVKRVQSGQVSKEEAALFVEYCQALAASTPPKGSADAWKTKTAALVAAAEQCARGDRAGIAALRNASNCKACHNDHKGE